MKDKTWLKILAVVIIVVVLVAIVLLIPDKQKEQSKTPKEETKQTEQIEIKEEIEQLKGVKLRNSEKILWEAFLNQIKRRGFIHEDNLDYFAVVSIVDYGKYLKKQPNIRFEQINYVFRCKDDTVSCVDYNLRRIKNEDGSYSSLTQIDLKNKAYINLVGGYVFNESDELVPIKGPFVYEGEED